MVDISDRLLQIRDMIDAGQYFTINRARQYGKTTTLAALARFLSGDYFVLSLDFQGLEYDSYRTGGTFTHDLARLVLDEAEFSSVEIPLEVAEALESLCQRDVQMVRIADIFRIFKRWLKSLDRPMVLMIDEVDSAANNQVFLDFLALLRDGYISRDTKGTPAFQSVILAGVTDVKSLKQKIRPDETHKPNSPWNIAADFLVDMSLSKDGIAQMLTEYANDHRLEMDVQRIASEIHHKTSGYPFLVSRICQLIDTQLVGERFQTLSQAWTIEGVSEAIRRILLEKNTLFDSLMGKVEQNSEMSDMLQTILFAGDSFPYNPDNPIFSDAMMYGFICNDQGHVAVANMIFETRLYNYFLSFSKLEETPISQSGSEMKADVIQNGHLQMDRVLERFLIAYDEIYGDTDERFSEEEGRRRFLLFIRPIINGTGNYCIEPRTRNLRRMDLVIDYAGERNVIELKIWRGKVYHEEGEQQLADYLAYNHLNKGYMLTYSFIKSKKQGIQKAYIRGKEITEAFV